MRTCAIAVTLLFTLQVSVDSRTELSPADDLKAMQGQWTVQQVYLPNLSPDGPLPDTLGFTQRGTVITIDGNEIGVAGMTTATIGNDLPLEAQQKEIGFPGFRIMMLTLPTGKGLLCSYYISGDEIEIAYTHKCSCRRGSGHVLSLKRVAK